MKMNSTLLVALYLCSLISTSADKGLITASGFGSKQILNDVCLIRIGVVERGYLNESASSVFNKMATKTNKVLDVINSFEVDEVSTDSINLYDSFPKYGSSTDLKTRPVGNLYVAENKLTAVTFNTSEVGYLLTEVNKAGANYFGGLSFAPSKESINNAKIEALKTALVNAKEQVASAQKELMMSLSALTLSKVIIGPNSPSISPGLRGGPYSMEDASLSVPISTQSGQTEVTASVEVEYAITILSSL